MFQLRRSLVRRSRTGIEYTNPVRLAIRFVDLLSQWAVIRLPWAVTPTTFVLPCIAVGLTVTWAVMSFTGTVKNGVVVLPPGVKLPEGLEVQLTVPEPASSPSLADKGLKPFTEAEEGRAFAPDPEWEAFESAMSQRQIPKPEPD